ncbi:DUF1294 domain-containing protein [Undibacterium oligocarboniphilum]|uniref:DUF1294 domain-containing protein n=2 Tax=Undibacterium oligocarboniphilum TaxID=666702 RepID=A0A850QDF9_9BURK|nr:DUF1294 domain-containing protein [Undibacterium oligocarboniphilum]NVO76917.1 DUF1294 domain-containing protein [Undibacterium oligocarboniphilum]
MFPGWLLLLGWYGVISAYCFLTYAIDQRAAVRRQYRISERRLLLLSLLGGWPGAWLAHRLLRHKIAKQSFQRRFSWVLFLHLMLISVLWLVLLAGNVCDGMFPGIC